VSVPDANSGEPQRHDPPRKSRAYARFLWVAILCLYAGIVWYVGWRRIQELAASMALGWFAGVVALETAGLWLRALKWRWVLGPRQNAVGVFFLSKGVGNLSPGRVGELSPLILKKHRNPKLAAWILMDRFLEAGIMLGLGVLGLATLRLSGVWAAVALGAGCCFLAVGPLLVLTRRGLIEALRRRTHDGTILRRGIELLASVSEAAVVLRAKAPIAAMLTIAAGLLELTAGVFLYRSFGYSVNLAMTAVARSANGLAGALPFAPSVTGVPHLATGAVMHEVAGIPVDVLTTALALHLAAAHVLFWTSFGVGMMDLRKRHNG
jgi:Lysylphosphatidylglycerol synthase TM region